MLVDVTLHYTDLSTWTALVTSIFDICSLWKNEESYVEMGMDISGFDFFSCLKMHQGTAWHGMALHSDDYSF